MSVFEELFGKDSKDSKVEKLLEEQVAFLKAQLALKEIQIDRLESALLILRRVSPSSTPEERAKVVPELLLNPMKRSPAARKKLFAEIRRDWNKKEDQRMNAREEQSIDEILKDREQAAVKDLLVVAKEFDNV